MKAAVCAVLLLLNLCQGEALICRSCFTRDRDLCTPTSVQACSQRTDACAAVNIQGPLRATFRVCLNRDVCQSYSQTRGMRVKCCFTDLCN